MVLAAGLGPEQVVSVQACNNGQFYVEEVVTPYMCKYHSYSIKRGSTVTYSEIPMVLCMSLVNLGYNTDSALW